MVQRIGIESLRQLKRGNLKSNATCFVKFYSQGCHYCHTLKDYFIDVAQHYAERDDMHFFAFNVDDVEDLDKVLSINGVPTIASFKGGPSRKVKISILDDPETPNEKTWYFVKDIKKFIESNS